MKAIVDCNSFYCSCEKVFRPDLRNKPVVVLSNNDGCIVSRTDEAKRLGVGMAAPYFQNKDVIEKNDVAVFSSNYHLYGDLSMRVMDTLRELVGEKNVEVYSVDEAFLDLDTIAFNQLENVAKEIKETVEQWTGIEVSVGVAPTKVLAKVANRLSKKNKKSSNGVMVLNTEEEIINALRKTAVEDIWGVGYRSANKLKDIWGIYDGLQLRNMSEEWASTYLGGVVGERLLRELKGDRSIKMEKPLVNKKMIATTRMFGQAVTDINDIKEAVATYTSKAAEKLRRQHSAAKVVSVFIVSKEESHAGDFRYGNIMSDYQTLPSATSFTHELIKPAVQLVDKLYKKGSSYKKAGVMLSGLVPDTSIQSNLFFTETKNGGRLLMNMIDNVNFSMRDDVLKFAASGTTRDWKMRQEMRSKRFTTRWEELFVVH
jgi:DNA polymerase V